MPYPKGDPRAVESGREGQRIRWSKATAADRAEANRIMQDAKRARYVAQAASDLTRLGLDASPEMVEHSATMLQKADLRERAALARDAKVELRSNDEAWFSRIHRLVGMFVDGLVNELGLTLQPGMPEIIARVSYMALRDEYEKPRAERSYDTLCHRLEDYRLWLHIESCPFTRWPDGDPCLVCGSTYGVVGTVTP